MTIIRKQHNVDIGLKLSNDEIANSENHQLI